MNDRDGLVDALLTFFVGAFMLGFAISLAWQVFVWLRD